ncbi:membrane protein [Pontibacillus halophilus JSM 076056 = DSM 19796]|uniref:Membrane protein n=1 Tax=Pontibacillus halophilus JSM 076056 = DSM 19796 TaxID=1385510 RepID=A0A0A5IBN1_9BACI|nr:YggT family protein [Pontibacillus halophilus]KGX93247.1 membrane protein [Pontibacillus halophilus JSM 076056 = DSM 19796]
MFTLYRFLGTLLQLYSFALIIYIFMSWFPGARESSIGSFIGRICEPYLEPFRRIVPPIGMLDLSPIVAILVLNFAAGYGLQALFQILSSLL